MSLQYYDITIGLTATQRVSAQGRYIYYLNGTTPLITGGVTPAAAGNQAIKVQAGSGGSSIILMPGQSLRLPDSDKAPGEWLVTNYKGVEPITGQVMIGEGDFSDSNTSNTFKLDATFANQVKVTNSLAERVPVSIAPTDSLVIGNTVAQRVPVTIAPTDSVKIGNTLAERVPVTLDVAQLVKLDPSSTINVLGNNVAYTSSFSDSSSAAAAAIQVFSAAMNPNGAWVEMASASVMAGSSAGSNVTVTLLAKATAPAHIVDGDVLFIACTGNYQGVNVATAQRIKVPAGKGLYISQNYANAVPPNALKTVLYTLL